MSLQGEANGATGAPGRRRRSFLATKPNNRLEEDTVPAISDEDDIPVLTEIVEPEEPTSVQAQAEEALPEEESPNASVPFDTQLEELATQMAQAIGKQMAYELPTLVEATLLSASEELRQGITSTMESALRDFIARRKQLKLPLDEPGTGWNGLD